MPPATTARFEQSRSCGLGWAALLQIVRAAAHDPGAAAGAPRGVPPMLLGRRLCSELEAGADVHHRRAPRVDRADDLLDINPLQIHAGGRDIRMPELPLDHRQRHPLPRELDRVSMAELVLVPTSAQASICRPLGYADASESRLVWQGFRGDEVGITRRRVVACSS